MPGLMPSPKPRSNLRVDLAWVYTDRRARAAHRLSHIPRLYVETCLGVASRAHTCARHTHTAGMHTCPTPGWTPPMGWSAHCRFGPKVGFAPGWFRLELSSHGCSLPEVPSSPSTDVAPPYVHLNDDTLPNTKSSPVGGNIDTP